MDELFKKYSHFFYRPAESCALGNNQKDLNKKKIESEIDKHKY